MPQPFNMFDIFIEDLGNGVHNLNVDQLECFFTNQLPVAASDAVKADIAEIGLGNGYAGPQDTQNVYTRSGTVGSCIGVDFSVTASGGSIGPFSYIVLFNDTAVTKPLIGWWECLLPPVTLSNNESFITDFGVSMFNIQFN